MGEFEDVTYGYGEFDLGILGYHRVDLDITERGEASIAIYKPYSTGDDYIKINLQKFNYCPECGRKLTK